MNKHTVRPFFGLVRELAQEAAAAPDAAGRAINGVRNLLPGEVFWFAQAQGTPRLQECLEAAAVYRASIRNGKLFWDPGMEQLGPNLLALVGYAPEGRNLALMMERDALKKLQPFNNLEWHLIRLLHSAARISVLKRDVLAQHIIELFQKQGDFEAGKRLYRGTTRELRIMAGSAEIRAELNTRGHLAALKLRFRRPSVSRNWSLPPSLGEHLMPRFEKLINK